jgi:hypothetical protein
MPREPLTLVGTSRTIRSVQSGIWAMGMRMKPRRVLRWSCKTAGEAFGLIPNRLVVALAKSQDHRSILRGFAFGWPDAVRRWSGLGYPAARASQSGERGLSPERGGERQSGRRESDGWLHTEVQVASGANCVEARLGSALLRDSPPEVRSKEYVSLWRNAQYRGVDIGKMEISVSLLRKVRGVSV